MSCMADIHKAALLILNEDQTKFLVTRTEDKDVHHWLLPGGRIEVGETVVVALVREIKEELDCEVDKDSLEYVGTYEAPAAGRPGQTVNIQLYSGRFKGKPTPSSEVKEIGWLSKGDINDKSVSEMIRDHVVPDLVARGILK
jgi:8-oxo-dGTP diphosphatase